ncbi:MAG: AAA family ATPase [Rhodoferax sp.]|nr:AAA family ATPase [Rhodoferax sp.]
MNARNNYPAWLTGTTSNDDVQAHIDHGWSLVPIPPSTKGPAHKGWNERRAALKAAADLPPGWGIGLAHAYSGTCALDIDDMEAAKPMLAERGIDLQALLDAPDAVQIVSGREGRAKLLYRLPEPLATRQIKKNGKGAYELRCATSDGLTVHDCAPPSVHPQTGLPYRWAGRGHWSRLPVIPQALLDLWRSMLATESAITSTASTDATWTEITGALKHINPDCSRQDWIKVGMALHSHGTQVGQIDHAFTVWDNWSRNSESKYPGERQITQQWASFREDKATAVTMGSVFKLAGEAGWTRPQVDASGLFSPTGGQDLPQAQHPLARFVDCAGPVMPPRWVIPGFIAHGVVVVSGAPGVGKTTAMLPLAMTAAGLHGDDALIPREWRHVVYVSEDVEQAKRILAGIAGHGVLNIAYEAVRERIHIVEAVRLAPSYVATVGKTYREEFTRMVAGVAVLPLVVIDTKSAVLALESENDNSEASAMMAALKQGFDGLPVWLIGHLAKQNLGRNDVLNLSSRGAGAIEGDANQTMFLVREGDNRFLVLGKTRFEPQWPELAITSHTATITAKDEFGKLEAVTLRWGIARPGQKSRKEAAEQAAALAREREEATLRQDILKAVESAWQAGDPLNRARLREKIPRNNSVVGTAIENLLAERWLHEVEVPAKERTGPSRARFLVGFSPEEHEVIVRSGELPDYKLVIPPRWKKSMTPIIPAPPVPNPPVP